MNKGLKDFPGINSRTVTLLRSYGVETIKDALGSGCLLFVREGNTIVGLDEGRISESHGSGPGVLREMRNKVLPIVRSSQPMPPIFAGMTLRDWFAGQALAGAMVDDDNGVSDHSKMAEYCYRQADAMIAEREKQQAG